MVICMILGTMDVIFTRGNLISLIITLCTTLDINWIRCSLFGLGWTLYSPLSYLG
ncbi:unnamed protein product [Amoebophrya sp. A120]|nr:unnamed protein product [Amoebophrya sp. A120]|eukprot:GSA120T00026439001.1